MTYGVYGSDFGGAWVDPMGNVIFTGIYDPWSEVYPSPGIMQSPYAIEDVYLEGLSNANPGGVGLVNQANNLFGEGNFISYLFPAYDTNYLLQASSQANLDNMLSGMGISDTYTDYGYLTQDSYYYYNLGVDTIEEFDPSNAYANDDSYYYGTMGYADSVADWASGF